MSTPACDGALCTFLARYSAYLVFLTGPAAGTEYPLDQERITLGRGPGVDLAFEDHSLSAQHGAIEFWGDGYVLRDLDSGTGVWLNGLECHSRDLKDGDHFKLGELCFEFSLRNRGAR